MSILFAGGSINIIAGDPALQNVAGATITCWIRAASPLSNPGDMLGLSPGGAAAATDDRAYIVQVGANISLFGKATDAGATQSQTDVGTITAGELIHLAAVFDYVGNRMILYRNAVERFNVAKAFGAVNTSNTVSNGGAIAADGDGASARWAGQMEDARIYSRVLGAAEILTMFSAQGRDGIVSGLQHRWTMTDQGGGATVLSPADIGEQRRGTVTTGTAPTFQDSMVITSRTVRQRRGMLNLRR